jgi:predicted transposase YbfD/YdcC
MVVKDNHKTLHRKLKVFFDGPCLFDAQITSHQTCEGEHGRLETRQLSRSDDLPAHYTGFTDVQQVFRIRRQVIQKSTGVLREETVYGLTSLPSAQASPKLLQSLLRQHWHIENKSHWVRDVVFEEDRSQVRCGNIPQVMAALRNTVIGLLRLHGKKQITATLRRHAARPEEVLEFLGIPKTE